mmetsp:Transcript_25068/g.78000  ORF Transcript_25068/g.78000 Transcript_25068/m.78000 type:complete len:217 (-) Transcript_25068:288-938(-)
MAVATEVPVGEVNATFMSLAPLLTSEGVRLPRQRLIVHVHRHIHDVVVEAVGTLRNRTWTVAALVAGWERYPNVSEAPLDLYSVDQLADEGVVGCLRGEAAVRARFEVRGGPAVPVDLAVLDVKDLLTRMRLVRPFAIQPRQVRGLISPRLHEGDQGDAAVEEDLVVRGGDRPTHRQALEDGGEGVLAGGQQLRPGQPVVQRDDPPGDVVDPDAWC